MSTKIYGCSDDLIEFEGDVSGEVCADKALLICSDGTLLSIIYESDGIWTIKVIAIGSLFDKISKCVVENGDKYSDIVTIKHGLEWAYASTGGWEKVK